MQVTLNIDASQVDEIVKGTVDNLSEDQKLEIVKSIYKDYLISESKVEYEIAKKQLLAEFKLGKYRYNNDWYNRTDYSKKSDEEILSDYNFQKRFKTNFKSTRFELFEIMKKTIIDEMRTNVRKYVEHDEDIQKLKGEIFEQMKNDFPTMCNKALIVYIANNLSMFQNNVFNDVMSTLSNNSAALTDIKQRLNM